MKPLSFLTYALIVGLFAITACSDSTNSNLSNEDEELIVEALSTALSDETGGLVSSLYDATANVSPTGISFGTTSNAKEDPQTIQNGPGHNGRGGERSFSHEYDSTTGFHHIVFTRSFSNDRMTRTATSDKYIRYTDLEGSFSPTPRIDRDFISKIEQYGSREGTFTNERKTQSFLHSDSLTIDGVNEANALLNVDGYHNTRQETQFETSMGDIVERSLTARLQLDALQLDKALVKANQNLEEGVTGSITYYVDVYRSKADSVIANTYEGTIEFNGDATALVDLPDFATRFLINLIDGKATKTNRKPSPSVNRP